MIHNSNHSTDMVGSIHTDNIRIRNPDSQFRPKSERQNAARERKPIQLPPIQLRKAFSYSFPFLFVVSRGNGKLLPRISSTLLECAPPSTVIIGYGRSGGCRCSDFRTRGNRPYAHASRLRCQLRRERESQCHVNG